MPGSEQYDKAMKDIEEAQRTQDQERQRVQERRQQDEANVKK